MLGICIEPHDFYNPPQVGKVYELRPYESVYGYENDNVWCAYCDGKFLGTYFRREFALAKVTEEGLL